MSDWYERAYAQIRRRALERKHRRLTLLGRGLGQAFVAGARKSSPQAFQGALFKTLEKTGNPALKRIPDIWWEHYFQAVKASPEAFGSEEQKLMKLSRELVEESLAAASWLELYRLCLISGLFMVGLELRAKAERRFIREAELSTSLGSHRAALAVFLERGEWHKALGSLKILEKQGESGPKVAHGRWLIGMLNSTESVAPGPTPFLSETGFVQEERALLKNLKDKRLAVVGPVPSKLEAGPEIDSFDLVAKFNYRGGEPGCDPVTQGRRVDIAYYNIEQSKYIARKMSAEFLKGIPFPVFIKDKGFRVLKRSVARGRVLRNLQWLLLDSEFNAGPNAVYDLLRFGPKELKVFNSDLMLTAGRFAGYWQPNAKEVNYCYSFAKTHDPVLQFRFFQHAWKSGLISGDGPFDRVMAMTLPEYIGRLQEAHGDIGREALCSETTALS